MAAAVFAELKWQGILAELVTEYAKDKVWEESYRVLDNQVYVFAKQLHRLDRVIGKVRVVVTDSPLLLSLHYAGEDGGKLRALVMHEHDKMQSMNVFLTRVKPYEPAGRMQSEHDAIKIDQALFAILDGRTDCVVPGTRESVRLLADRVIARL